MGVYWAKPNPVKNIVILGGSYGGLRAANSLADQLEGHPEYRIIVIDRNSHMNHLYVFPRFSILPGHEFKAFIPYTRIFTESQSRHLIIQANVLSMTSNSVTISRNVPSKSSFKGEIPKDLQMTKGDTLTIPFEYAIYALGATLPDPINVWKPIDHMEEPGRYQLHVKGHSTTMSQTGELGQDGSKASSITWLQAAQKRIANVKSVIVVGGGALGIQIATDTAEVHPQMKITLIHSREHLMQIYDQKVHEEAFRTLQKLSVDVNLNERLDMATIRNPIHDEKGQQVIKTLSGRTFAADAIFLCTGAHPNNLILSRGLGKDVVNPTNGYVRVLRTLQVTNKQVDTSVPSTAEGPSSEVSATSFSNIFAIGDVADAFGAIKAGHTAYNQGEVAANNIASLISKGSSAELQQYQAGPPAIKVTLGIKHYVYQEGPNVVVGEDGVEDLHVALIWQMLGFVGDIDMHQ